MSVLFVTAFNRLQTRSVIQMESELPAPRDTEAKKRRRAGRWGSHREAVALPARRIASTTNLSTPNPAMRVGKGASLTLVNRNERQPPRSGGHNSQPDGPRDSQ